MHMMTCQILVLGQNTRGVTALIQSTSFKASSIFLGSMDDTNEKYLQNDANLDLVCTPLEISPMIESNG